MDPDGRLFETAWDLYSLASGLRSLAGNVQQGQWGAAAVDAAGVVADGAAVLLPGMPGGAGAAIGTIREPSWWFLHDSGPGGRGQLS